MKLHINTDKQTHHRRNSAVSTRLLLDARNHYPITKHHTPPPRRGDNHPHNKPSKTAPGVVSGPNSVSGGSFAVVHPALAHYRREPLTAHTPPIGVFFVVLLRKEVIQPHLPVRLPCYDFVPIASPTFDGSLHKGWATGFGCYRLSWCDGRCVQGPGTYSPRRC